MYLQLELSKVETTNPAEKKLNAVIATLTLMFRSPFTDNDPSGVMTSTILDTLAPSDPSCVYICFVLYRVIILII